MKKTIIFLLLTLLVTVNVYGATTVINAFNSGELSPLLEGRTDIKKYYSGCRTLQNMIVLPHGGVTRRPGSYYVAGVKDHNDVPRLIPCEFSITQAYIIEMGDLYLRFYKDGGQITSGDVPYEISTPYLEADIFDIHYIQSADTMYFVHPDYPPMSLTRTGHTSWTLDEIDFKKGPFLDEYYCTAIETQATGNLALSSNGSTISLGTFGAGGTTFGRDTTVQ